MKVLMLGWEFPPHISGGLGTACFGLTQGLAHHGVDVSFVVPRARGDEDQRFVRVHGANQVPIRKAVRRTRSAAARGERATASTETLTIERAELREHATESANPLEFERWTRISESLELLAVDSALRPYLTEQTYREHIQRLEQSGVSAAAATGGVSAPDARTVVAQLKRLLTLERAPRLAPDDFIDELAERGTLEFSGVYGPNLMAEVARYAFAISHLARDVSFDVIHAHDWMTIPAGLVAAHVSGKPLIVHMHACEYDRSGENVNREVRDIEQLGLEGADLVVCVSHYTAGILGRRYRVDPAKLRVVHNAVTHRQQIELLHEEKHIDEPIVLFLGRVTFQKGPDYFLEAAARVVKIQPKVKFVMSGSGDMLPVMIERAAKLGLARHMHFTGFLKGDEVERMYALADIYVMPSVSEPFGISPLEAMALDVPVIMSRQSGVSEILRNALKVDFWDVVDMANKILALLKHAALRDQLIEDGREEIQNIRWDYPAGLVRDVYREVVR